MPTYRFFNKDFGNEFEEFMSISECDKFLEDNPNIEQLVSGSPLIHSGRGLNKPDNFFRDRLKEIKRNHRRSNINTF